MLIFNSVILEEPKIQEVRGYRLCGIGMARMI